MVTRWLQIILYVTTNTPIPTHRDLWRPARSTQLASPQGPAASGVAAWPMSGAPHGLRQHLMAFLDVTQPHPPPSPWQDLKKQPVPAPLSAGPEPTAPAMGALKQKLAPAPRHEMVADKKSHEYLYRFEGRAMFQGRPAAKANIVLRLASGESHMIRKSSTDAEGRFHFAVALDGKNNEPILWWLHADQPETQPVELEGSRILEHDHPRVTIERDIEFLPD